MEHALSEIISTLLQWLSLPQIGLSAIFVVALVSATLLPLGSEPVVFAYVTAVPNMFWPAVVVATVGNTIGGVISYWMGWGAKRAVLRWRETHGHEGEGGDANGVAGNGSAGESTDARSAAEHRAGKGQAGGRWHALSDRWLTRLGPSALFFAWLPVVGDPLCAVAGYLRLAFWPCVLFMAIGKFLRYVLMTYGLVWGWAAFSG